MKKFLVAMLAITMVFAMCACGEKKEEEPTGVANPVVECTYDELIENGCVDIKAPDNATEVKYSYIQVEGEEPISQVTFELDDEEFCYRAQPTGATSIMAGIEDDGFVNAESITDAIESGINVGATLSGLHYDWKTFASVDVQYCEGICAWNEDEAGFIAWLDVAPGIVYSLGMDDDCEQDLLMNTAEAIFVPVQGNVG